MNIISSFIIEDYKNKFSLVESKDGYNVYGFNGNLFLHLQKSEDINKWKKSTRYLISKDKTKILFIGKGKYIGKGSSPSKIVVKDHVNVSGKNPLIGQNDTEFGPRFFDVNNIYEAEFTEELKQDLNGSQKEGCVLIPKSMQNRTELETEILNLSGTNIIGITQEIYAGVLTACHAGIESGAILKCDDTNTFCA